MDESARWLIQQERREEAKKVLRKAVRQNKAKLPVPLETIIGNLDQVIPALSFAYYNYLSAVLTSRNQIV